MGTVSIDLRSVDTSDGRVQLGGSSPAAGSSNEDPEPDEATPLYSEDCLRGALQPSPPEDQKGNGGRFPAEDPQSYGQILKFSYPKGKRNNNNNNNNGKKPFKRKVTFAL
ncbi:uncharacterized protein LOC100865925 [Apis florea]|uniref:uncharacterized protein LOC100865925 n=1 Tax=Apis florea TaxID=7463 RepID=UPI000252C04C|nr:uncharacterized protein LOC100865925 [Apis florea]XP_003696236.1 uncharacterized protein LOC100865925 [Apis florea]